MVLLACVDTVGQGSGEVICCVPPALEGLGCPLGCWRVSLSLLGLFSSLHSQLLSQSPVHVSSVLIYWALSTSFELCIR